MIWLSTCLLTATIFSFISAILYLYDYIPGSFQNLVLLALAFVVSVIILPPSRRRAPVVPMEQPFHDPVVPMEQPFHDPFVTPPQSIQDPYSGMSGFRPQWNPVRRVPGFVPRPPIRVTELLVFVLCVALLVCCLVIRDLKSQLRDVSGELAIVKEFYQSG